MFQVNVLPRVVMRQEVQGAPVPMSILETAKAHVEYPKWVKPALVKVIRNLQCFEIVRRQTLEGFPSMEIARMIHSLGELRDHHLDYLENAVKHYRATVPKGEMVALRFPTKGIEQKLKKTLNVRDDLEKLKNWMFERLELAVNREKSFGMLMPNTEKSFTVALDIVSKIHEIQEKEIGSPQDVRAQANEWTKTDFDRLYDKPGINETIKDPGSRMKIARFLDQTFQLVGGMDEEQRERVLEAAKNQAAQQAQQIAAATNALELMRPNPDVPTQ